MTPLAAFDQGGSRLAVRPNTGAPLSLSADCLVGRSEVLLDFLPGNCFSPYTTRYLTSWGLLEVGGRYQFR